MSFINGGSFSLTVFRMFIFLLTYGFLNCSITLRVDCLTDMPAEHFQQVLIWTSLSWSQSVNCIRTLNLFKWTCVYSVMYIIYVVLCRWLDLVFSFFALWRDNKYILWSIFHVGIWSCAKPVFPRFMSPMSICSRGSIPFI